MPIVRRAVDALPGMVFLIAIFGLLEWVTRTPLVNAAVVPSPSAVLGTFGGMVRAGTFWVPLAQTLALLAAGYGAGCLTAIVLGILMGAFRPVYDLFEPITELIRPIPKPALLPAFMLFLGLGAPMKISLVALSAFFPVLINAIQGTRSVDPTMVAMAKTFGHGRTAVLWRIMLPATAPYILAGMRISLGISIVVVVLAEMLASSGGVGAALVDMQHQFFVKQTYAWVLLLALLGLALNGIFTFIERRVTFWYAPSSN
jgi:ABC-type nitrate/sulfonate/bicarbonate transport system permease component